MKVILHIDINAFFASCHEVVNPLLKNQPLVVAHNTRDSSIITTANYKARGYGIKAGMPIFKARELFKELTIVQAEFQLYVLFSNLFFELIYRKITSKIEIASIDECYLDVTDQVKKYGSAFNLALYLQKLIWTTLELPTSIGISHNKFLAKTASNFFKPMGICTINKHNFQSKINYLPINEMTGVGPSNFKILESLNIKLIKDIANEKNESAIINALGSNGKKLIEAARGTSSDIINLASNNLKSISNEISFSPLNNDYKELKKVLFSLSHHIALRAQKRNVVSKTLRLSLKYIDNKRVSKQLKFEDYANDQKTIANLAIKLFDNFWTGKDIKLLGLSLDSVKASELENKNLDIFTVNKQSFSPVNEIIRNINSKYGKRVLKPAKQAVSNYKKNNKLDKIMSNDSIKIDIK